MEEDEDGQIRRGAGSGGDHRGDGSVDSKRDPRFMAGCRITSRELRRAGRAAIL
jgi:hypothetical protein